MRDMMTLIEPLIPGLRRYARALMKDTAAADDLVQDCLERAVAKWYQRRAGGDTRPWLYRILHNLAVNRLRQQARRGVHVSVEDDDLVSLPAQEAGLVMRDLASALDRLPEEQRAVLLLVSVEDLSYAEAASALDISVGTVMSRLSRARERLRKEMAGEGKVVPLRSVK